MESASIRARDARQRAYWRACGRSKLTVDQVVYLVETYRERSNVIWQIIACNEENPAHPSEACLSEDDFAQLTLMFDDSNSDESIMKLLGDIRDEYHREFERTYR